MGVGALQVRTALLRDMVDFRLEVRDGGVVGFLELLATLGFARLGLYAWWEKVRCQWDENYDEG